MPVSILLFRAASFWGGFLGLFTLESLMPYRPASVSKRKRVAANLSLTIFNSLVLSLLFSSAAIRTAQVVTERRIGVLNLLDLPPGARLLFTIACMDFVTYIWHFLNHELPLLWRFHRVHHSDMNMDVSTASRFHIGELAISSVIKICLIYFLGADLAGVAVFEGLLVLAAQFHHSSLRVSEGFEQAIWIFFVPPSMHRIHHSVVIRERNTNYGTIFSFWDRMFGTFLKEADQEKIVIGMGAYRDPEKLNLRYLLGMPFTRPVP